MADYQTIEITQVRWDCLLLYNEFSGATGRTGEKLDEIRVKAYSGDVTEGARKRMAKAVDLMIQFSRLRMKARPGGKVYPFRMGFVTLTVPGKVVSPKEVMPYFKRFLDWLRYRNCLYVYKIEYQKRGQIHFHLIVNRYIHWKDLQAGWNKIIKKGGFLDSYALKHGHFMPNSTDVRGVKSNKALANYLLKYLAKSGDKVPKGAVSKWWGASQTLLGNRFTYEASFADKSEREKADKVIQCEEGRWMMLKGRPDKLMGRYSAGMYAQWRINRTKASWVPTAKKAKTRSSTPVSPAVKAKVKADRQLYIPLNTIVGK